MPEVKLERHSENDVFCTIKWSIGDIVGLLETYLEAGDIERIDDDLIDKILAVGCAKILHERSVEEGWTILDDIVSIALD